MLQEPLPLPVPPSMPSMRRRRLQADLVLMLADAVAILAGYAGGAQFAHIGPQAQGVVLSGQIVLPIYWTMALALRAYGVITLTHRLLAPGKALMALLLAHMTLLFAGFMLKPPHGFAFLPALVGMILTLTFMVALRWLLRSPIHRRCRKTAENVLVIDDEGERLRLPRARHISASEHGLRPDLQDPHMLDRIGHYMRNMDRVLVSCPSDRRGAWSLVFKSANISGEIVDRDVHEHDILGSRQGTDYGTLIVSRQPLGIAQRAIKRAFDIALAGAAILALAPLLALVALLIKLEDGGPVLFVQNRTGRNNRFFKIYKFRSMRAERTDATGARSASLDDDRITPVGRLIRRTSIDELPQLFNVLRGDMSIVGPRPHAIGSLAGDNLFWEIDNRYWLRHAVKPGLTGLAQVRGLRGATETESDLTMRLQSDLEYLDRWTIWRDIAIIIGTLRVLVHDRAF